MERVDVSNSGHVLIDLRVAKRLYGFCLSLDCEIGEIS